MTASSRRTPLIAGLVTAIVVLAGVIVFLMTQ